MSSRDSEWSPSCHVKNAELYTFRSIGICRSVFDNKRGVPRQGMLAPSARGKVELHAHLSLDILRGLEEFSHVWIIFVFSRNNNLDKNEDWVLQESKPIGNGLCSGRVTFSGSVRPPLLGGAATGVYSTRSPHRPNPIGMTLAKILKVDAATRSIEVSSIDLCDGTPVLDIKPFCPGDIPLEKPQFAQWVLSEQEHEWKVVFTDSIHATLESIVATGGTRFYDSVDSLKNALREILSLDVRAVHQGRKQNDVQEPRMHQCVVDGVKIFFLIDAKSWEITVTQAKRYQSSNNVMP